ncbi:hypothetical protein ACFRE4_003090 [Vibrio vulnificus]
MMYVRFFILLLTALAVLVLVSLCLTYETALNIQPNLKFVAAIFAFLVPLTINIKSKIESIPNIDNLKHKQINLVRTVITGFISRIWAVWALYAFTTLSWLIISFWSFKESTSLIMSVSFSLSLGWMVALSCLNLYSLDLTITSLNVYMKELSLKLKEKESALKQLSEDIKFSDDQKQYFDMAIVAIDSEELISSTNAEKPRWRLHVNPDNHVMFSEDEYSQIIHDSGFVLMEKDKEQER